MFFSQDADPWAKDDEYIPVAEKSHKQGEWDNWLLDIGGYR